MRKQLLCSLLLISASGAIAQEFHLSGGYNGSNVREAGAENWVGRAGYQFGADVLLGQRWFVKPGIHFMVRNLNYTYSDGTDINAIEYKYTSRMLSIPVMLGLNLMDPATDPEINAYVMGGPTALMHLNADLNNSSLTAETSKTQWYLGFAGGLEASFLFAEAGYNIAMTNVFKGKEFQTNPEVNYVYALLGVRLRLAK